MDIIMSLNVVSKSFFSKRCNEYKVLKNINLEVKRGEMLAITGESGSGKTTLLNVLGCITEITIGTYVLNNQKVNFSNHKSIQSIKNQMIGFVVQDFNLLNDINVYDNVELPLLFNPNISLKLCRI